MRRTVFSASVLSLGVALVSCGSGSHDDDVGAVGDSLKGRDNGADAALPTKPDPLRDDASACAALLCPVDTQCVVKEVQCIRAPCPPVASCEPIEAPPPTTCAATTCLEGTTCVEGPKGAQCVERECSAKCDAGQHCELQEVVCVRAPCPPVPTCVDDLDACATVRCKAGTHCVSTQPQCFTTPCPPHAECVAD